MMTSTIVYFVSLILVLLTAWTGMRFRPGDWYQGLSKPPGLPPNWVFPLVWTILYLLMAIAAARVWLTPDHAIRTQALMLYAAQLVANAAWSWLFFGLRRMTLAALDSVVLLTLVVATTLWFARVDALAGYLLWPYVLWLVLALYLNLGVIRCNRPQRDGAERGAID